MSVWEVWCVWRHGVRQGGGRSLCPYPCLCAAGLASGMSWGLYFFFYERCKLRYHEWEGHDTTASGASKLSFGHHSVAALEASALTVLVTNPIWLVKTRLQLQVETTASRSRRARGTPVAYF